MRLFISNSSNKFIIGIILLIIVSIILFIEYFYIKNDISVFVGKNHDLLISQSKLSTKPTLFILGDSRAEAGIIPELIDSNTKYDSFNLGIGGVYKGYYNELRSKDVIPNKLIVAVSPYSMFKNFKLKKDNILNKTLVYRKPNLFTEKYFSGLIGRNTHLSYGLMGFLDVLNYGKTSSQFSKKGWHGYDRLGSDTYYTYMVNLEAYKNKIIEGYKDSTKVNAGKKNFDNLLIDMKNKNIDVLFVRIPVSKEIRTIEDKKYPWFSNFIRENSQKYGYNYIDFNDFQYPIIEVDGSHLNRNSAKDFTEELIVYIK